MIFDKQDFIELCIEKKLEVYNLNVLKQQIDKNWMLLIGHDNNLTGAPLCLYELATTLKGFGYLPVIITAKKGKLIDKYLKDSIPALIIKDLLNSDFADRILHLFSLTFVNTIVGAPLIKKFNGNGHNIIWWIHESEPLSEDYVKFIPKNLSSNIHIYCVSELGRRSLLKVRENLHIDILHFGVDDFENSKRKRIKDRIEYFNLAAITKHKGQDVLLDAIDLLNNNVLKKARFVFGGFVDDINLFERIKEYEIKYPDNVKYIGEIDKQEVVKAMNNIDCYICSSKNESLSRTVVEASSASKIVICSECAGICDDLIKNDSGLIYHNNDATELASLIEDVTMNTWKYNKMKSNSRGMYLKKYTKEIFADNIRHIISEFDEKIDYHSKYNKPLNNMSNRTYFSIYMDVGNASLYRMIKSIISIKKQSYTNRQLCFVEQRNKPNLLIRLLIKFFNSNRKVKYNQSIKSCNGQYIIKMKSEMILNENALELIKEYIDKNQYDFIYCDNEIEGEGIVHHYKPGYSPDTLKSYNYIGNFYVFRKTLFNNINVLDENNDYEMVLKLTNVANNVGNISETLYSVKKVNEDNFNDTETLSRYLNENNISGEVMSIEGLKNKCRIKYEIVGEPLISIIICNKNNYIDLSKCINSILNKSSYRNLEIIVIDNGTIDEKTLAYYSSLKDKNIKIIKFNIPFNFSRLNNEAIKYAKGKHYLFLNNDIEVISPNWIQEMLMFSQRENVGVVGAKLYYPNKKIQHAGVILDKYGRATHIFREEGERTNKHEDRLLYVSNYLAVTGACMMIKSDLFNLIGGFDEELAVTYNDIDLCMKLYLKKYVNVWTPFAELYHYESKTRGQDCKDARKNRRALLEFEIIKKRFEDLILKGDPFNIWDL